ncbi:MAG: CHAP domain-containing protein [Sphingomonas sp.]|jgi:surface antigen
MRFRVISPLFIAALASVTTPARAESLLDYVGECVPFARAVSGIQLYGDAWTWWDKAQGHYQRGDKPQRGAVVVFERIGRLPLGHVAVVSRVIDQRVIMVTHANWSRINGERGHVEQDVTLTDVSPSNDWSQVRVWHAGSQGLGTTIYPIDGFIYEATATGKAAANPNPALSSPQPDEIAALIDAYR